MLEGFQRSQAVQCGSERPIQLLGHDVVDAAGDQASLGFAAAHVRRRGMVNVLDCLPAAGGGVLPHRDQLKRRVLVFISGTHPPVQSDPHRNIPDEASGGKVRHRSAAFWVWPVAVAATVALESVLDGQLMELRLLLGIDALIPLFGFPALAGAMMGFFNRRASPIDLFLMSLLATALLEAIEIISDVVDTVMTKPPGSFGVH
jgi:hypothetical protein